MSKGGNKVLGALRAVIRLIFNPYHIIMGIAIAISASIFFNAFRVSVIEAPHWNAKADSMLRLDTIMQAVPQRGDILACDGMPLAQTVALYTAFVDFSAPRVDEKLYSNITYPKGSDKRDTLYLDYLCDYLAKNFPTKTKKEYADYITARKKVKSNSCVLVEGLTNNQFEELKNFWVFNECRGGYRTGLTRIRSYKRYYPYDSLTSIVLGRAVLATKEMLAKNKSYRRNEWHGTSGLERGLDKELFGIPGKARRRQEAWGFGTEIIEPPISGNDIVTTLDMTIQEIAARNLMKEVKAQRAEYGTAIVMDVATGEIRAMINVDKAHDGKYTFKTRHNYATRIVEPGSVVKTLSMMLALNRNPHIDVHREASSLGAVPEVGGYKKIDCYKEVISPHQVIVRSDNRGICKIVSDTYRGNYRQFIYDIEATGIMHTCELPLPGTMSPQIHSDLPMKTQAEYYSFAQMIFGYHNRYSPLSTLSIYNAIANNGRLMKPQIIKAQLSNGEVDTIYAPVCLNENLCSPEVASTLRAMLYDVVNDDAIGTARRIGKGRVKLAGKTGTVTAQREISYKRNDTIKFKEVYVDSERRIVFAGFFPYENPQYSCIVLIDKPRDHSAGGVAGGVFKAIAEEMYSRNMLDCDVQYKASDDDKNPPRNKVASQYDTRIYKYLNQYPTVDTTKGSLPDTLVGRVENKGDTLVMPSVVGMTAGDALYLLESMGMNVSLNGVVGRVVNQSVPQGTVLTNDMNVTLNLK